MAEHPESPGLPEIAIGDAVAAAPMTTQAIDHTLFYRGDGAFLRLVLAIQRAAEDAQRSS